MTNDQNLATQATNELSTELWTLVADTDVTLAQAHGVFFNAVLGIYEVLEGETGIDLSTARYLVEQNVEISDEFIDRDTAKDVFFGVCGEASKEADDLLMFMAILAGRFSKLVTKEMMELMEEGLATAMPLEEMANNMMHGHKAFEAAFAAA